jgi:hypothetical protein
VRIELDQELCATFGFIDLTDLGSHELEPQQTTKKSFVA